MSIKIYTYTNPYTLEEEEFWDDIRCCPQFCVSQTLVNGFRGTYDCFNENLNITTIKNLINLLYKQWDDFGTKIKQMIEVDNAIGILQIEGDHVESVRKSLYNNAKNIANSLRILAELNLNPFDFKTDNINIDQKYLVDIYKIIFSNPHSSFTFKRVSDNEAINNAIKQALIDAAGVKKQDKIPFDKLDFNTVVINGVHQFSPAMLCAIEDIAKVKNVVLIFNYQKQYQKVYQTWLDIYSLFNTNIKFSSNEEFEPNALLGDSYKSNMLADCIGKMSDCKYNEKNEEIDSFEVIEFENNTEFANYVAQIYEEARKKKRADSNPYRSPLRYMEEQFYSASPKVNDILRAYFPEQFEQRHFLDYPIGHFFIATMNMWDSENEVVVVNNFSDIKECLTAGILAESKQGLLINTFNQILPYIEDLKDYNKIISRLKELKKNLAVVYDKKKKVGYFNVSSSNLAELIQALLDLKDIVDSFYRDFKNGEDNFRHFYEKVKKFIMSKVNDTAEFDNEIIGVMRNLLDRMGDTDIPNSGSFITLRQTLSYYLSQDENINHGAKWIVRGFEQIDGDILKSDDKNDNAVYHFCCLSDKDICANKDEHLSWPLDVSFFNYIQIPLDWKYQLYVKAKTEYHNFNRYALIYGLEFCRNKCKLSYVKTENDKENDLYHILSMLGIKVRKFSIYDKSGFLPNIVYPKNEEFNLKKYVMSFDELSRIKISLCPYKFGVENIAQNDTVFRDRFLIHMYMRILIKNMVLESMQGKPFNEKNVRDAIKENFDKIDNKFRLCTKLEEAQLTAQVYKDVVTPYYIKNNMFKVLSAVERKKLIKDEHLLDYKAEKDLELLKPEQVEAILSFNNWSYNLSPYCKYCASKDVCLENKNN